VREAIEQGGSHLGITKDLRLCGLAES
jgi:hypothetical protein